MLECVCTSPSEQSSITLHHNQCEASIDQCCHVVKAFSSSSLASFCQPLQIAAPVSFPNSH